MPCLPPRRHYIDRCISLYIRDPLDSRTRTTTSTRFALKFFRVFSKYRPPRKASFYHFLPEKLALLSLVKEINAHDIRAKTRSRMTTATTFSRQNDDGSRVCTT